MVTIRHVAKHAGVSIATVSRVLNDSGYADPDTRAKVHAAIEALGYERNVHWSRLASQSSKTLVFLLGNRSTLNSMQMRLLIACEQTLRDRGYDLVFSRMNYAPGDRDQTLALPRILAQPGAVDGVVLVGLHFENLLQLLRQRKLPFVALGNNLQVDESSLDYNTVLYDDENGVFEAVGYLARLKHRRIAFVGNTRQPWFARRHKGYERAIAEARLKPIAVTADWRVGNLDYGQMSAAEILRATTPPTAIIAANDELAAGVWKELTRRKVAIPDQISLIGFGDRTEFSILEPSLTSVSVYEEQLGERLGLMLLELLQDDTRKLPKEVYPCKLMERHSCAPLATPPVRMPFRNVSSSTS
jgi:LacI family transcriptional regulator